MRMIWEYTHIIWILLENIDQKASQLDLVQIIKNNVSSKIESNVQNDGPSPLENVPLQ